MSPAASTALLLLWLLKVLSGEFPTNPKELAAEVRAAVPAAQPAGIPVMMQIHFTNTGRTPLRYWSNDVEPYPPPLLVARVTSIDGSSQLIRMSNGQGSFDPLDDAEVDAPYTVAPGQTIQFPAMLPPLRAGEYNLTLEGVPYRVSRRDELMIIRWPAARVRDRIKLIVRDDPQAALAYDQDVHRRIQQGDVLAFHLVTLCPRPQHVETLMLMTLNNDPRVALRAAEALRNVEVLPPGADAVIGQAIYMWAYATREGSYAVCSALGAVAQAMKTEFLLDVYIELAKSDERRLEHYVQVIARFPQARANAALRGYLFHPERWIHEVTLRCLAERKDPEARRLLLQVATDPTANPQRRKDVILSLANYAPEEGVMKVLRAAVDDPEEEVREAAGRALRRAERSVTTTAPTQ